MKEGRAGLTAAAVGVSLVEEYFDAKADHNNTLITAMAFLAFGSVAMAQSGKTGSSTSSPNLSGTTPELRSVTVNRVLIRCQ